MKKYLLLFLIVISSNSFSQEHIQSFLTRINIAPSNTRQAIADSFVAYARNYGIPFIESDTAAFIYRGTASSVSVAGDFTDWGTVGMNNISGTNFFYLLKKFEMNARLDYKFVINSSWILDPENPHLCSGGYGPNSELAMPEYIQPWEIQYRSSIKHGKIVQKQIYSNNVSRNYNIAIYLPPDYNPEKSYPSVYFQDGSEYINLGSSVNVIDNLIDSLKINKVIAVFVTPNNRNDEYAGSLRNSYAAFFARELVPFIDSLYSTIKSPDMRLVMGDSYGGNISAIISYNYSDVFGNCGLHSGAFQPYDYEILKQFLSSPKLNIKFSSVWGTYESLWGPMRTFRDSMITKGYSFKWLELPEGHSWGQWRATTDKILTDLFPYGTTGVEEFVPNVPLGYSLEQNYPNPFNPSTNIKFTIPITTNVTIKIYNVLGKEIAVLTNEIYGEGTHELRFSAENLSSGVYFYTIKAGNYFESKRMVYLK